MQGLALSRKATAWSKSGFCLCLQTNIFSVDICCHSVNNKLFFCLLRWNLLDSKPTYSTSPQSAYHPPPLFGINPQKMKEHGGLHMWCFWQIMSGHGARFSFMFHWLELSKLTTHGCKNSLDECIGQKGKG